MNRRRLTVGMIATATCCILNACSLPYEPGWAAEPISINLSRHVDVSQFAGQSSPELEFSADGKYICVAWLHPKEGTWLVFDRAGNGIPQALDDRGRLTGEFVGMFPTLSLRTINNQHRSLIKSLTPAMKEADFLAEASCWWLSNDGRLGFRMINPISYGGSRADVYASGPCEWTGEMWEMQPRRRLWTQAIGPMMKPDIYRVVRDSREYLLLANSDKTLMLRMADGAEEEEIDNPSPPNTPWFFASTRSFLPEREWLARGEQGGLRVRVVSISKTPEVVFEGNRSASPDIPLGGVWSVDRVAFAGTRYLIVDYHHVGRLTIGVLEPTEIYNIDTWKKVWSENSTAIGSVALSPDGATLAFIRSSEENHRLVLEMGPFDAGR